MAGLTPDPWACNDQDVVMNTLSAQSGDARTLLQHLTSTAPQGIEVREACGRSEDVEVAGQALQAIGSGMPEQDLPNTSTTGRPDKTTNAEARTKQLPAMTDRLDSGAFRGETGAVRLSFSANSRFQRDERSHQFL